MCFKLWEIKFGTCISLTIAKAQCEKRRNGKGR